MRRSAALLLIFLLVCQVSYAANMLANPSFESGSQHPTGWVIVWGPNMGRVTSGYGGVTPHDGSYMIAWTPGGCYQQE
ncbi:hypothetical protein NL526_29440, partial [Klebsiella pneumoniae]|nr:hypothetical protein [Klebsiella pneumoniae]